MSRILRYLLLAICYPIRYLIRYEINLNTERIIRGIDRDIRAARQRKALKSTVDYIDKNLSTVSSVDTNYSVITSALNKCDLSDKKLICEFGVYSGSTINHIATHTEYTVFGFDSFEGLPEKWRDGYESGHFSMSKLPTVLNNVVLIKGWFKDSLPVFLTEHEDDVGFLHIDCDLYTSTKTIFDLLKNRIKPGCVIVFDEYFNYPNWEDGEFKAFHEFLEESYLSYEYLVYNRFHQQVAVKIKKASNVLEPLI